MGYVFAVNYFDGITVYSMNQTGTLTPVPGSPFPAGINPSNIFVEPAGRFGYVASQGSDQVFG